MQRTLSEILIFLFQFIVFYNSSNEYKDIHFNSIVVDTHNDVLLRAMKGEDITKRTDKGHSDISRMKEGGLDCEIFSVWVSPFGKKNYFERANEMIDTLEKIIQRSPEIELAKNYEELHSIIKNKKIAALIGIEGGHIIENSLEKLEELYKRGVIYITITWNNSTEWASSGYDEFHNKDKLENIGLTEFGKKVIKKMEELGIIVDVSHIGERTFWDIMEIAEKPVIASHSSVYSLCPHYRNLKDEQIKEIAKKGGVVFINFYNEYIDSNFARKRDSIFEFHKKEIDSIKQFYKDDYANYYKAVDELIKDDIEKIRTPLKTLIEHIDYVVKLVGVDYVGLGSDFDGIPYLPSKINGVQDLPIITQELLKMGYKEKEIRKILGENFLRVLKKCR